MGSKDVKRDIQIMLILFLLSCTFFWRVLLNPEKVVFAEYVSDIISYSLPFKTFIHETWQSTGHLPLWNPYVFMGSPFVANPMSTMFYPQNLLYLILQPDPLFGFLFLLDIFLIGIFTYFFVKLIGVDKFGALVSAAIFMFSGIMISRVYAGHPMNVDIATMTVLAFLMIETAIQKRNLFYGTLAGIPIGLQLLGGNVQVILYSLTALGIYFILRFFFVVRKNPKDTPKLISIMILAVLVGVCLAAIQLLPSLELSKLSSRAVSDYEIGTAYSFPPEQSLTFLMPEFFGTFLDYTYWGGRNFFELCVYTGVFSIVLMIMAFIGEKNKYKTTFFLLLIFSFLFALGKYFPLYTIFYYFVPFSSMFRKPPVMLFLTAFSISVLSGFGVNVLTRRLNIKCRKRLSALIKVLIILSFFTLVTVLSIYVLKDMIMSLGNRFLLKKYEFFTTQVHTLPYELKFYIDKIPEVYSHILNSLIVFLITLSTITTLLYLRVRGKMKMIYFQSAVLIIILLELWFFGMKYIEVADTEMVFAKRHIIKFLEDEKQKFRVLDLSGDLEQYISMRYHIEAITGYDPIQLKNYKNFIDYFLGRWEADERDISPFLSMEKDKIFNNSKILGLLNMKYLLTTVPFDKLGFELKFNVTTIVYIKSSYDYQYKSNRGGYLPSNMTKQVYIYENNNFLPRAFVVRNARIVEEDEMILKEMSKDDFDPKEHVILEKDVKVPLTNSGEFKEAEITYYSPNKIHVNVDTPTPGFLVLSENWYPGWKAYDNGNEREIYKTDYILRSIHLDKGQHDVKFVYDPLSFKIGFWVTVITIISLCIFIIYHQIHSKR